MSAAEDIVDHSGGALFFTEAFRKEGRCQCDNQRRRDAGGGNSGHKEVVTLTKQQRTGNVGGFIHRAAKVEGAHRAYHNAQQNRVCFLQ